MHNMFPETKISQMNEKLLPIMFSYLSQRIFLHQLELSCQIKAIS